MVASIKTKSLAAPAAAFPPGPPDIGYNIRRTIIPDGTGQHIVNIVDYTIVHNCCDYTCCTASLIPPARRIRLMARRHGCARPRHLSPCQGYTRKCPAGPSYRGSPGISGEEIINVLASMSRKGICRHRYGLWPALPPPVPFSSFKVALVAIPSKRPFGFSLRQSCP